MTEIVQELSLAEHRLAYQQLRAVGGEIKRASVIFLSGYGSDMAGTKASFLDSWCSKAQVNYLRFDYRGTGRSSGAFLDGTIGGWFEDALAMIDQVAVGPQILVGSSMGGWLALMAAKARPEKIVGVLGIAAAPDFTEKLVWDALTQAQKDQMMAGGVLHDHGMPFARKLIEEGRRHLVLDRPFALECPVHLIQGMADQEVPWRYALRIASMITSSVSVTLVPGAEHNLSRNQDLELIGQNLALHLGLEDTQE